MIEYIYIVKCPGREDEMFNFFTDARMQCDLLMSKKPIITQVEVERNDFGECTDSRDLGTVWSWEEVMKDTDAEPAKSIFTKDDVAGLDGDYNPDNDSEFIDIDNSVDFEVEEASDKESLKEAYELKGETTKGELYELLVNRGQTVTLDLGDYQELGEQFSADDYNNSELTIVFNPKGRVYPVDTFSAYETRYSDDGNTIDGDFELETTSFETLWDELLKVAPEFFVDDTRMPVPEGMTIEQLVEEMEENEDTVECTLCNDLFDKSTCRKELNLGWLCRRCADDLVARGEGPVFKEDNYWDFLDEDIENPLDEDLEWHTYKITFSTAANPGSEHTTIFKTWQDDVEYAWRKSNENVPHTTIKNIELVEETDPKIVDDLGSTYDGGYPTEEPELPETDEIPEVSDPYLKLCPECGKETFDIETGICVECGFN